VIGDSGAAQVSLIAVRDSDVEVDVGVHHRSLGLARQRLLENMQGVVVVAIGVERESEIAIGLGVRGIDAEGSARFG